MLASTLVTVVVAQQQTFTATSITKGTGPDPPTVTAPVPQGTYSPPASVVVSGTTYPPPSYTGMGRRLQLQGADNFCLLAPPDPTTQNLVDAEADAVAYCLGRNAAFNNTRPMPDFFIRSAHFRRTPDYVSVLICPQISGSFLWTRLNLNPADCGGALDFAQFMGGCDIPTQGSFCLRACTGPNSYPYCRNTFDLMGCLWTMPGDYTTEGFTECEADSDLPIGVYNSSYTFQQGDPYTPPPVAAPSSSNCRTVSSPAASGVTYTFAQLQYESGYVAPTSSGATSSGGKSQSATGTAASAGATKPSSGGVRGVGSTSDTIALGAILSGGVAVVLGAVLVL
ncbi:hypothetical protein OIV83_004688 [Microbotryomycetes sp. JL201]|nr:hypothetical protein OIV83_004688 [Microbotryomycetes sp. JL201]